MEHLTTHPIKKSDLGFHGNLFGGKLLSWLDAAAVSYAMQLCDTPRMVTVSIDKCYFEKPSKEGQLVKIFVIFKFNLSLLSVNLSNVSIIFYNIEYSLTNIFIILLLYFI